MGWFSRKLKGRQREEALALVHHLQGILAYQQLAMEIYNDAFTTVVGEHPPLGAEVWDRQLGVFNSPELVSKHIIPALEKKIEIIKLMKTKHEQANSLATKKLQRPYQEMTSAIREMLDRAQFQLDGFTKWVRGEQKFADLTQPDELEQLAIDRTLIALNDLIYDRIGLTFDEWIAICREAINSVRTSRGLAPLDSEVYRSQYIRGLQGERVRFFND